MIGQCGITMQEYKTAQVPEIGYLLAHKYWHKGYAVEAATACREYGFNTLKFDELYSIIRDTNIASQKVALRNGMNPIDSIVKHYRGVDMPHLVYCVRKGLIQIDIDCILFFDWNIVVLNICSNFAFRRVICSIAPQNTEIRTVAKLLLLFLK